MSEALKSDLSKKILRIFRQAVKEELLEHKTPWQSYLYIAQRQDC